MIDILINIPLWLIVNLWIGWSCRILSNKWRLILCILNLQICLRYLSTTKYNTAWGAWTTFQSALLHGENLPGELHGAPMLYDPSRACRIHKITATWSKQEAARCKHKTAQTTYTHTWLKNKKMPIERNFIQSKWFKIVSNISYEYILHWMLQFLLIHSWASWSRHFCSLQQSEFVKHL